MKAFPVPVTAGLVMAVFLASTHADPPAEKTLDDLIAVYDHTNYNPDENTLVGMGQKAADAIYDAMYHKFQHVGRTAIRPEGPASARLERYERLGFAGTLLMVTGKIESPIPVERLCRLVDEGCCFPRSTMIGPNTDAAVCHLLAASGHPKALAYLQRCRSLLQGCDSVVATKEMLADLDRDIAYWKTANQYMRTGAVDETFQPSPAMRATRAAFQQNAGALEGSDTLDDRYLATRLSAVTAMLNDLDKSWFVNLDGLGLWYESLLLPRVLAWLDGDRAPLTAVLGDPDVALAAVGTKSTDPNACVRRLVRNWSDAPALPVFLKLMKVDRNVDVLPQLLPYKTELWYADYVKELVHNTRWTGEALLPVMAKLNRPYNDDEKSIIGKAICRPLLRMAKTEPGKAADTNATFITLARREPQLFRDALKTEHLSAPVVDAILQAKLCDDMNLLLQKCRYAMTHDGEHGLDKLTPERLAKLPPAMAARAEAAMATQKSRPRKIEQDWLDLLVTRLNDHQPALALLREYSADPLFTPSKPQVDAAIASLLKLHPDWK